jgi:hypothetical protein
MQPRLHSLRLPLTFDAATLQSECDAIPANLWVRHYNKSDFEGDWSGAALRSRTGSPTDLSAIPGPSPCFDTPLLSQCPSFQRLLAALRFPLGPVRLLALQPGSVIREHSDPALSYEDGEVRLHIPIRTSNELDFYLDRRRLTLAEGETWYLNLSLPHSVHNRGARARIHLVIDGAVNTWLQDLFARTAQSPPPPAEPAPFARFRDIVIADPQLRDVLLAESDKQRFISLAVHLARQRDIALTPHDLEISIRAGLRSWHNRGRQL